MLTLAFLAATPRMLREMSHDCTGVQVSAPPKPGEWAIVDVVRHLVEGDRDTLLPRLRRMLTESRPVFPPHPRLENDGADLATLLDVFERARADVVRILGALDGAGWAREGVSPSRGPLTVEAYAASTVAHDTEHLRQILRDHDAEAHHPPGIDHAVRHRRQSERRHERPVGRAREMDGVRGSV